jgi:hypothetical protein
MMAPFKQSKAPASMAPYSPTWRPRSTCPWRAPIMVAPCSSPRAPLRLAYFPGSRCGKHFPDDVFVKKVF